jgi:hypothetical protein
MDNLAHLKNDIGFYEVGNLKFSNKYNAVLEAQKTNSKIFWNFHDSTFNNADWLTEPEISLDRLYTIRAEQIRNSYDYVIVFCSGGADSTNVIKTFINQKIKVDEVIALVPESGLKNWKFDHNNVSEDNTVSEIKFALYPLLNEISKHNIKITVYDFFQDIINYKDEKWTVDAAGNIVTALTTHFTNVDKLPHIKKLIDQGKRIALVYGSDKPIIKINNQGELLSVFADGGVNYLNMPQEREYVNVDRVLFYWTPDLPEISIKQAHVVLKMLRLPEYKDVYQTIFLKDEKAEPMPMSNFIDNDPYKLKENIFKQYTSYKNKKYFQSTFTAERSIYQKTIVPFIYPSTFTKNLFQCQKVNPDEGFFTRDQDWIHILHRESRASQMMMSGLQQLYNSISPNYLNSNGTGFINNFKVYKFGKIKDILI